MSADELLQKAESLLAGFAKGTARPEPNRLDAVIQSSDLVATTTALRRAGWGFLSALTGVDLGKDANQIEALYHVCEGDAIATLRVTLPRTGGAVPTVQAIYPNALFFERELMEMFGVTVKGLADTSHLYLPDGWPEGTYPLLKDTDVRAAAAKTMGSEPPEMGRHGDRFIVPVGPQHPALKEPGHFEFAVDGELVTGATVRLGYVHRGIERACEQQNYTQNLYLVERVCGICSHSHVTCYCQGVEEILGLEIPDRARYIRTFIGELERIQSHLFWVGTAGHETGWDTLLMYTWKDRERVNDMLEQISGNRIHYAMNTIGGVRRDIREEDRERLKRGLEFLEERARYYNHVIMEEETFLSRTVGVGHLPTETAKRLCCVGPTVRASNVRFDVRADDPYAAYEDLDFAVVTSDACDVWGRAYVKTSELLQSIRICNQVLDHLPGGEIRVKAPLRVPAGEAVSRYEAPRGELIHYIKSNGSNTPERMKIRSPTLANWLVMSEMLKGVYIADVPIVTDAIDPCLCCSARVTITDGSTGKRTVTTLDALGRRRESRKGIP
jgi:NADH-quinone oxidoreductase subunit D